MSAGQVIDATAFDAFLGVNTHLTFAGTAYKDVAAVEGALNYLGVDRLRDVAGQSYTSVFDTLAGKGFRFDFFVPGGADQLDIATVVGRLESFVLAHPSSVVSIEGPNEINRRPITYEGETGLSAGVRYHQALHDALEASPVLASIPLISLSLGTGKAEPFAELGDLSAFADQGNAHVYLPYGAQPGVALAEGLALAQGVTPGRPLALTETGYSTDLSVSIGVDEPTQAKQTVNLILDAAKAGVTSIYLFELVDNPVSSGEGGEAFGLFRSDWTPKPAATAVRNLMQVLTQQQESQSPSPAAPDYEVTGLGPRGGTLTIQEPDGTYDLVVWAEPEIWDPQTDQQIAAPSRAVTIALSQAVAGYAVYDPLVGDAPIQSGGPGRSIEIAVSDHPVIVELHGAGWFGTAANDELRGADGVANHMRGEGGDDVLIGGNRFNDINGNQGNDQIVGRSTSGDILRGGQGDDVITGGAAGDWLSGDLGQNTVTGGGGADIFYARQGGASLITDFDGWAGDRIQLDPGTPYLLLQAGSDLHVILDQEAGGELVLQNVQPFTFDGAWIVGG